MADVARLNLTEKGVEARQRSLMEDLVEAYIGIRPGYQLSLAAWFGKVSDSQVQHLLFLYSGPPMNQFARERVPLLWKTGSQGPPFVEITATSVEHFSDLLISGAGEVDPFFEMPEILYFDKTLLPEIILKKFGIVTEPPGLMKGWYVDADHFLRLKTTRDILSYCSRFKFQVGFVKTEESSDFANCRGLIHAEFGGKWLPLSLSGLNIYTFYNDWQDGKPGIFVFQGGSLYRPLKFEEKVAPEYSKLVLVRLPNDRYPEVYLRSVHPSEEPAH